LDPKLQTAQVYGIHHVKVSYHRSEEYVNHRTEEFGSHTSEYEIQKHTWAYHDLQPEKQEFGCK
jgi:hypothetical protein